MVVAGMTAAVVIGMVLATLGGGGSILTVPVLVYVVGLPAVQATAYSLFVVGLSAAIGAMGYARAGHVNLRIAAVFAAPSLVAVFVTRRFVVPAIPDPVFSLGSVSVGKDALIMTIFAVTMLLAALSMIRGCLRCRTKPSTSRDDGTARRREHHLSLPVVALEGLVVGTITGLVGAGGGFLIIPALVLIGRLGMKEAVGTSLVIITVKSLIGFLGDVGASTAIDWGFLLLFTALTALGIVAGMIATRRVESARLRPVFGWFVLGMGALITIQQVLVTTTLG